MQATSSNWVRAQEDNLSTGSSGSNGSSAGETISLRFPRIRRRVIVPEPTKKNAVIMIGTLTIIVICGAAFGTVHSMMSGDGNDVPGNKLSAEHHKTARDIIIKDIDDDNPSNLQHGDEEIMQSDEPPRPVTTQGRERNRASNRQNQRMIPQEQQPPSAPTATNSTSTSTRSKKKTKNRTRRPLTLPEDAQIKHPLSILYQMKLVENGEKERNFFSYTHCEDDLNDKKIHKGWKAELRVNETVAAINSTDNYFVGYGSSKVYARKQAAERALMFVYPGKLQYFINEQVEIKEACGD